jgi:beta-fructofuranosidase
MYFNEGIVPNEIGDFEVVENNGQLHIFYLSLDSHDAVGHLVSDNGIDWRPLPTAIRTGDPGEFDSDQIWTMGVCKFRGTWFMLYTANLKNGLYQVTGLATSKDLIRWKKYDKNPVAQPDPRWYEAKQRGRYRVDWRDPHMIVRDGKIHAFLCARENKGLLNHRGCAGYFTSTDGYRWKVQPPACTPRNCWDYECPSVFELNGRYYMVAIHGGHDRGTYRVADRVEGPYRRLHDDSLMPKWNMSVRPCVWRGKTFLFHWNRGQRDWGAHSGSGFACIASPKRVRAERDGSLVVESFDWSALHAGRTERITKGKGACGQWQWKGDRLVGYSEFGMANWLACREYEDFELTADLQLGKGTVPFSQGDCPPFGSACEFGFVFRADETGDQAMYARCVPGRGSVELVKQIYNRRNGPDSMWRGRSVVQRYHFIPSADGRYTLRLIAFGPNIEFNVNRRLAISELSLPRRRGRLGVFVEDGKGAYSNIKVTPLREPRTRWDW